LECIRARERHHVEVKGVQGPTCSFVLTANERRAAEEDPAFVLFAVTNALQQPMARRLTGEELLARGVFEPVSFRVRLRDG
jgi:hypothetical protein